MRWRGVEEFTAHLRGSGERLRVEAARGNFETAKRMRDLALGNMGAFGIGLVTGRSRALFAAAPAASALMTGGSTLAYAGYTQWPADVEFYPHYLNTGTRRMVARPYYDAAIEAVEPFWRDRMQLALDRAMA